MAYHVTSRSFGHPATAAFVATTVLTPWPSRPSTSPPLSIPPSRGHGKKPRHQPPEPGKTSGQVAHTPTSPPPRYNTHRPPNSPPSTKRSTDQGTYTLPSSKRSQATAFVVTTMPDSSRPSPHPAHAENDFKPETTYWPSAQPSNLTAISSGKPLATLIHIPS